MRSDNIRDLQPRYYLLKPGNIIVGPPNSFWWCGGVVLLGKIVTFLLHIDSCENRNPRPSDVPVDTWKVLNM